MPTPTRHPVLPRPCLALARLLRTGTRLAQRLAAFWLLALAALLGGTTAPSALAATYTSASTPFSLIDSTSHTKVGYNTAPYKFNAAAGCGTAPPTLDDTLSDLIPIGFNFVFGGTTYTGAYIQSNGRLQFGNVTCGAGTNAIGPPQTYPYGFPDPNMNAVMKVFEVDLDHTALSEVANYPSARSTTPCTNRTVCYVSVATLGVAPSRQFVVTWKNVPEWVTASNTSGSFDLQIVVNEDGSFVYQYGAIVHGGTGTAQIGWQVSTTDFAVLAFGAASEPAANTAIIFYIPLPVASYQFEEGAWAPGLAGQVSDASGNSRPGSSLGNAQPSAAGKVCRGLDIPANTSAVDAVKTGVDLTNLALNLQGTGTAAFWYKSNTAWASGTAAQLLDATAVNGEWFYLTKTATGTLYFEVKDSTGVLRSVETAPQAFAANTWVHIAIAWNFNGAAAANSDALLVWVNGAAPTTANFTSSGTVTTQATLVHLGDNPTGFVGTKGSVNSANGQIDEANFYNFVMSTAQLDTLVSASRSCTALVFDHLELQHASGSGITCTPTLLTIRACKDAACRSLYTSGIAGTLKATGAVSTIFDSASGNGTGAAFAIPSGSSSVTKGVQVTAVGSALVGVNSVSVTASGSHSCNFGTPSCTVSAVDSGLLLGTTNHTSDSVSRLSVAAVKKADNSLACVPAFANVSKSVSLKCSYANPASGSLAARVGGVALNAAGSASSACDASGAAVSLAFDGTGQATPSLQYADVGQINLVASYSGSAATNDTGLAMSGSASVTVAPASFGFSAISAGPIKAGANFSTTVSALNVNAAVTPNFGKEASPESVTLSFTRAIPTGPGASNGVFSGSLGGFSNGRSTVNTLSWSEVGSIDLSARLSSASYLGSGLNATGSTGAAGAVGSFIPHHFDVAVTPACATAFSYAGQPFAVTLTARNAAAATTLNYDGSATTAPNQAKAVTLSNAPALGLGSLSGASVAATAFSAGVASASPSYAFSAKQTGPQTLTLRATDTNGASSVGFAEGSTPLRSGRLRLSSAFGAAGVALQVPLAADYWSGAAWLLNSADACTSVPAGAVALSNPRNHQGSAVVVSSSASAVSLASGSALLSLAAPTPATSGVTFDLALNLGSTATDQSCQANHPASTGAALAWLRSTNGACAATADRDPAARVSFGVYSPESRKTVHVRELF